MRSTALRIALVAVFAATAAIVPATLHAAGPAAGEGATLMGSGLTAAAPATPVSNKEKMAAAKAAWKASQLLAQDADMAPMATPFKMEIRDGKLTVDGTVARQRLDYNIEAASQLNVYLPGEGTLVITPNAAKGATLVKAAFVGNTLAFTVAGHTVRLTTQGGGNMMKGATVDAYVLLDKSAVARSQGDYLMMGYTVMQQTPGTLKPAAGLVTVASR